MFAVRPPLHRPVIIQRLGLAAGGDDDSLPLSQVHGEITVKEGQTALGDNNTVIVQTLSFLFALPMIIFTSTFQDKRYHACDFFLAKWTPIMIIMTKKMTASTLKSMNLFLRILAIMVLTNLPLLPRSLSTVPNFLRFEMSLPVWSYN